MKTAVWAATALVAAIFLAGGTILYQANAADTPDYKIVTKEGAIEVRSYPALYMAEVTTTGDRRQGVRAGFRPLANYIFAKEREGEGIAMTAPVTQQREKIAMTAPVTQTPADAVADDRWIVRFVMPPGYTLESLPKPKNSKVRLLKIPGSLRATIRFSGRANDKSVSENERRLRDWLVSKDLTPEGPATYAYYDAPFVPGFLRRNEVMFDLKP